MNRDTIIGFVLIAVVLIGFSWWNQPSAEQIEAARLQDSLQAVAQEQAEKAKKEAKRAVVDSSAVDTTAVDTTTLFHATLNGTSEKVVLKNSKLEVTLDTKGGVVRKAVIKDFKSIDNQPDVTLFDEKDQNMTFMLAGKQENIVTSEMFFTPTDVTDSTVTMMAKASNGGEIALKYRLGKDYLLSFSLETRGLANIFAPSYKEMEIEWTDHCRQQEKGFSFENRYTSIYYKESKSGSTDKLSESSDKEEQTEEQTDWVAFRNQFFSVALISKDNFAAGAQLTSTMEEKGSGYLKQFDAKMKTAFDPTGKKASEFEM